MKKLLIITLIAATLVGCSGTTIRPQHYEYTVTTKTGEVYRCVGNSFDSYFGNLDFYSGPTDNGSSVMRIPIIDIAKIEIKDNPQYGGAK